MHVVYAQQTPPRQKKPSIFLAGPSLRSSEHYDWRRPEALEILTEYFNGTVYVPLPYDSNWDSEEFDHEAQVDWELEHLHKADSIAFWIPRNLETLPGFTTNVELGMFVSSGKMVLGYPPGAPKMSYPDLVARRLGIRVTSTLTETLLAACTLARR